MMSYGQRFALLESLAAAEALTTVDGIYSTSKSRPNVYARRIVWYIGKYRFGMTYNHLADLHHRDHTTVIHGVQRVRNNPELLERVRYIEGLLDTRGIPKTVDNSCG